MGRQWKAGVHAAAAGGGSTGKSDRKLSQVSRVSQWSRAVADGGRRGEQSERVEAGGGKRRRARGRSAAVVPEAARGWIVVSRGVGGARGERPNAGEKRGGREKCGRGGVERSQATVQASVGIRSFVPQGGCRDWMNRSVHRRRGGPVGRMRAVVSRFACVVFANHDLSRCWLVETGRVISLEHMDVEASSGMRPRASQACAACYASSQPGMVGFSHHYACVEG